jgi:arginine/lysine/ornithine decarboxylase
MLEAYAARAGERWHMPGHKGVAPDRGEFLEWAYDVTEIDEMLETPNPVQLSEQLMAESYGTDRTWYSVAGATLPVMVAMLAAFKPGARLWVDRTMHRSVFAALVLGGYDVQWLYPPLLHAGLTLPVTSGPGEWGKAEGLVITRPTYDGLAADIGPLVKSAHHGNLIVVVDEAHGSHWVGFPYPPSALRLGADLVAHGVHKTQETLTQTGLLHAQGPRVAADEIDRWWRILATTSPSYLLLASLDRLQWARRQPGYAERWIHAARKALALRDELAGQGWILLQPWAEAHGFASDPLRLTVMGPGAAIEDRVRLVGRVEKTTAESCTFILSPGQRLEKLRDALGASPLLPSAKAMEIVPYPELKAPMRIREAWEHPGRWVPLAKAVGCIAKDALTPYPPGIPLAVSGEMLSHEMIDWLLDWSHTNRTPIQGIKRINGEAWVWVVAE